MGGGVNGINPPPSITEKINMSFQLSRGWPRPTSPPSIRLRWTERTSPPEGKKRRRARVEYQIQVTQTHFQLQDISHWRLCCRHIFSHLLTGISSFFFEIRFKRREQIAQRSVRIGGHFDWKSRSSLPPNGWTRCQGTGRRNRRLNTQISLQKRQSGGSVRDGHGHMGHMSVCNVCMLVAEM